MKKKEKIPTVKTILELTIYQKRITNKKKYTIIHKNKDGSLTRCGIARNGKRFKTIIFSVKTEAEIKKIFNSGKKIKDGRKNNVTLKMRRYSGKYIKKTGKIVNGENFGLDFYNIDKKSRSITKDGKIISYTNDYKELIKELKLYKEKYNSKIVTLERNEEEEEEEEF